jgi:hypothetical protein
MSTEKQTYQLNIPLKQHGLKLRGYMCIAMYGLANDNAQCVEHFGGGLSTVELIGACEVLRVRAITDTLHSKENEKASVKHTSEQPSAMPTGIEPEPEGETMPAPPAQEFPEVADPFYRLASNTRSAIKALYDKNGTTPFYLTVNAHKRLRHAFRVTDIVVTLKLLEKRGLVQMDTHDMSETAPKKVQFLFTMPSARA